ncbi:MAG: DHH family phosphoesterase, partial [Natronospirillum sp.]
MKVERLRIRDIPATPRPNDHWSSLSHRILASRGLSGPADELRLSELLAPDELKGISEAADLLLNTLKTHGRILVVGDYDVDGATSTALMVHCLGQAYGAQVDYFIPSRFTHGYGLSPAVIVAIQAGDAPLPDL